MTAMLYFLLFSFVSKNLTNYGRRHLKLFTNCHVSWDTLYITKLKWNFLRKGWTGISKNLHVSSRKPQVSLFLEHFIADVYGVVR